MPRFGFALALALALAPAPALAQDEEAAVRAVVDGLFDAMRAGARAAVRAAFHPEARFIQIGEREGRVVVATEPVDGFVQAVGTPHAQVWDERIWDYESRIDDRLASVWTKYAFYLGETFSHCGVDAMLLAKGDLGWSIVSLSDTRRREGCDVPEDVAGGSSD